MFITSTESNKYMEKLHIQDMQDFVSLKTSSLSLQEASHNYLISKHPSNTPHPQFRKEGGNGNWAQS